jgi:hypothetical protein
MAVYVLIDEKRHCCKIGFSRDMDSVKKRLTQLQTSSPFELKIAGVNYSLAQSDERNLHKRLSKFKTGGGREWFDLTKKEVEDVVCDVVGSHWLSHESIASLGDFAATSVDCCCDCNHSQEVDEHGYSSCQSCSDMFDSFNECCIYCVSNRYDLVGESESWYRQMAESIMSDQHWPPYSSQLFPYLSQEGLFKPALPGDVVRAMLLDSVECSLDGISFGTIAAACMLVHQLSSPVYDDKVGEIFPVLHLDRGNVLVAYPCEFSTGMPQCEVMYHECFWDVDLYGCQLFVCCVNSARDVRYVPLSIAKYQ